MDRQPTLAALTSVRFLAAFHVVLYHFVPARGLPFFLAGIVGAGYTGVSFFFVLSGFVLAYNYLPRGNASGFDKTNFWIARVARVYPAYVFALGLGLIVLLHGVHASHGGFQHYASAFGQLALTLTMLQAWTPKTAPLLDAPAWSLSDEAFFYLVFPWFGLLLVKLRNRALGRMLFLFYLLSIAAPVAAYQVQEHLLKSAQSLTDDAVKFTPIFRLPEFLLGTVTGILFGRRGPVNGRWASWITIGSAALLLAVLSESKHLPYLLVHNGLLSPLYALVIVGLASGGGIVGRLLSYRPAILLGEASYAIYLIQVPLWDIVAIGLRAVMRPFGHGVALTLPIYLPILVAFAVGTYLLIEKPARGRIRERFRRSPLRPTSAISHSAERHTQLEPRAAIPLGR